MVYYFYGLVESPPNICVFRLFFDDLQTFVNIDDIVDPASLDLQLGGDLVEFEGGLATAFQFVDEASAEFFEALFFAIVGEDLHCHLSLLLVVLFS